MRWSADAPQSSTRGSQPWSMPLPRSSKSVMASAAGKVRAAATIAAMHMRSCLGFHRISCVKSPARKCTTTVVVDAEGAVALAFASTCALGKLATRELQTEQDSSKSH